MNALILPFSDERGMSGGLGTYLLDVFSKDRRMM